MKVVSITKPHQCGINVQEGLEHAQGFVDNNEVTNLFMVFTLADGSVVQWLSNTSHRFTMLGAIDFARTDFINECSSDEDE